MGVIKSALELALEKTQNVESDRKGLHEQELISKGKKIASSILADYEKKTEALVKAGTEGLKGDDLNAVKAGCAKTLLANITLPADEVLEPDTAKITRISEALMFLTDEKGKLKQILPQLEGFFTQFIKTREQLKKAVEQQYAPRLKAKEAEIAARTGSQIKIDPYNDPDFIEFLKQNTGQLEAQYSQALGRVKTELQAIFGIKA